VTAFQVVVGWTLASVQLVACALAGHGLRRRLVPLWHGPCATLVAAVAAVAVLVGVEEILGSVGLLRQWALPPALVTAAWLIRPRQQTVAVSPAPEPIAGLQPRAVRIAALFATAVVAASWIERVVAVYRRGLTDGDSMMYHLVFAARFVQTGWTTGADAVGPDAWVAFYPANVELVQASLMLPFGTDVLVPFINLGWLAIALAASWCIGAEVGRGPLGLVVGALLASVPVTVATQAGTARVDIAIVALVLAAVALVLHQPRSAGSCAVAGLALGLAIGSKFALLPLAGLVLAGVALAVVRRDGVRAALAWSGATVAAGAYWYARNWVITGSPVPYIDLRLGGVGFTPLPEDRRELLEASSIVDNMGRSGFWRNIAWPVAEHAFGAPLISAAVVVAVVAVTVLVARERPLGLRHAVVIAGIGGCLAYPFSPYTAPLLDSSTSSPLAGLIVALNVRYLLPSLAVILCLLPVALHRLGRGADLLAGATTAAVVYLWIDNMGFDAEWPTAGTDSLIATALVGVAAAIGFVAASAAVGRADERRRPAVASTVGVLGTVAVACIAVSGWVAAGRSGLHRYEELPPGHVRLWEAAGDAPAEDIALLDDWVQYPLMGDDLDRHVHYVGFPRDQGLTEPPRNCQELATVLAAGSYDVVVVQRPILTGSGPTDYVGCLRDGRRAEVVLETDTGAVLSLR